MNVGATVDIQAEPSRVWEIFADPQHWPEWTPSVTSIEPLDGPRIEVGHRFRIKQPRLPALIWEVTETDARRSWTWVVRRPGAVTSATHVVEASGSGTRVTQVIDQRGLIGAPVGWLMRRMTVRYLELEGNGLKAASEGGARVAATS